MDIGKVQALLKLMDEHKLAEIELEDKDTKIRMKKDIPPAPTMTAMPMHMMPSPGAQIAPPAAGGVGSVAPTQTAEEANAYILKSPIVGTFYRASSPEAEPFAEVGDPVNPEAVVCIVEAMKVMNEVKAEVSGTILKVLVENGKPVEYGQPLFLVTRR